MTDQGPLLYEVIEIENTWIPMPDGCRLAARIWMPENAQTEPVPAILEYLPYRKRDGTAERDATTHPYFAARGYACIRVDMRGNGESDGLMFDEYVLQEQDDALAVIDWLTAQSWCSGTVGMIGISWGGFNGLQVAARRPPALKAVISICSTDDRYADDIHYMGGCLLNDNLSWATTMLAYSIRPPDPLLVGDGWRKLWRQRLENLPFLADTWLQHQRRDAYWRHGSICENYDDVQAAVLLVGGWADGYSNTIFRMLKHMRSPVRAIIGPWAHKYPHFANPGPRIGFLQECLRWWDHWLKDRDTGVMEDPLVKIYLQESLPPKPGFDLVPGRWVSEAQWPSPEIETKTFHLNSEHRLADTADKGTVQISSAQTVGRHAGRWFAFGMGAELPLDQRVEDQHSVAFDSAPLTSPMEICGAPVFQAQIASDQPCALLAARLCDLRPDGSVSRISYGVLNLTHHLNHAEPKLLEPGRFYPIRLQLNEIGWRLQPGHRIRLSLSNTYWPMVWPSPHPTRLRLDLAHSRLDLPVRPPRNEPALTWGDPDMAAPMEQVVLRPSGQVWRIEENAADGAVTTHNLHDYGERIIAPHGLRTHLRGEEHYRISAQDPLSARVDIDWEMKWSRDGWQVSGVVHTAMWADAQRFYMTANVRLFEQDTALFHKSWNSVIDRQLV
jgi:putative CocE/NonD family hydrolase